jgi:hypothetical protein
MVDCLCDGIHRVVRRWLGGAEKMTSQTGAAMPVDTLMEQGEAGYWIRRVPRPAWAMVWHECRRISTDASAELPMTPAVLLAPTLRCGRATSQVAG